MGAITKIQELGFDEILLRSQVSVAHLSQELVYIGFSNGGACAELLATTMPGARGVVLIGAPLPIRDLGWTVWPEGVPVQIHFGKTDSRRNERVVAEFASRVRRAGAVVEEHVYQTAMDHFADPDGLVTIRPQPHRCSSTSWSFSRRFKLAAFHNCQ